VRRRGWQTARRMGLTALVALAVAGRSAGKVSDARLAIRPVPPQRVRVSGEFGARLALTAAHLKRLPKAYLLAPFKRRTGRAANGQLMGQWIEFMTDYAAVRGDEALQRRVTECAAALVALQRDDGFIGLDETDMDDGWVANRLVTALLRAAEAGGQATFRSAGVRLAKSLGSRFPPPTPTAEQAVVGRCVLEALCRAYDHSRDYALIRSAGDLRKRDRTGLLTFLTENRRLGYRRSPPWRGSKTHEVLTYLNGLCALDQVSASAQVGQPIEDAWADIDRRHRYVTGGLPAAFNWRHGTGPGDSDDAAATADWLLFSLNLWYRTGRPQYIEMVERILLNHLPFAQTADGQFTSHNDLHGRQGHTDLAATGEGARAMSHVLGAICSARRRNACVNLYIPSTVRLRLEHGVEVALTQTTAFPANGTVTIAVEPSRPSRFTLCLRQPSWSTGHTLTVNGEPVDAKVENGTITVSRTWQADDRVVLTLSMGLRVERRLGSRPGTHQVALCYGPLVMCVDSQYNPSLPGPFQFVARRGHEAGQFTSVPPASIGKPAGPFPPPVAVAGQAFSAGRKAVITLTPLAYCARRPNAWWRVWLTIYRPRGPTP